MISQELKLYEQPTYSYKVTPNNQNYNLYQSKQDFTIEEIKTAVKEAKKIGIKPGNKYKHKGSTANYFITITGWDFQPDAYYYNNNPQVILAKGNHEGSVDCGYSVNEIMAMELIK